MNATFVEDTGILSDIKIVKMMSDYGFLGFGYYMAVVAELYKIGGKCDFEDLGIIAKNTGIDKKKLRNFIDSCSNKYTCNGIGIFQNDNNSFWSEKIKNVLNGQVTKKSNGKKGGRPQLSSVQNRMEIEGIEFVNLEKTDYQNLIEKFGKEIIDTGIQILDNWLAVGNKTAKEYIGKNHYYHFRKDSWVINEAQKKLQKKNDSQNTVEKAQELQAKVAEIFAKRKKKQ